MALEKSVLTDELIAALLQRHYGLTVHSSRRLALGSANCYRISSASGEFFLKEFQSDFSESDLVREAGLLDTLAGRGIPVSRILPTRQGAPCFACEGHLLCLQTFIEGNTYGYDDMPESLLPQAARMLGRLHAAMQDLDLPVRMDGKFFEGFSPDRLAGQYDALLAQARTLQNDPNQDRLLDDLTYKRELAFRLDGYARYASGVTLSPSHGDYQGCQLIWQQNDIRAVIDFSAACTLPVVWEVMRSYVQSSSMCRRTARIDTAGLCAYVREYLKYFPLTRADLRAMPYVYLFQLAKSKYGFPQYLSTDSPDREGLLRFAFWRTDMCREVEKKAKELSGLLQSLLC